MDVKITNIDEENKKVSLSIRALMDEGLIPVAPQEEADTADEVVYDTDAPTDYPGE